MKYSIAFATLIVVFCCLASAQTPGRDWKIEWNKIAYSPPVEISDANYDALVKNGVYTGNHYSDNYKVPAIKITTGKPVTLLNCNTKSKGEHIRSSAGGLKLTVRNCTSLGLNPDFVNATVGRWLVLEWSASLVVENNYFENTKGIYCYQFRPTLGIDKLSIRYNLVKNIDGRKSAGPGAWYNSNSNQLFGWSQFVQLNQFSMANIEIAWNEVNNDAGNSRVEDNINFYIAGGTSASLAKIHNNWISGAYNAKPFLPGGYSGGGILPTDGTTTCLISKPYGYAEVYDNIVLSSENYHIASSGGYAINIHNNQVYFSGYALDPTDKMAKPLATSNVGYYMWNMKSNSTCWGDGQNQRLVDNEAYGTHIWYGTPAYNSGNQMFSRPSWDEEYATYNQWLNRVNAAKVRVGPLVNVVASAVPPLTKSCDSAAEKSVLTLGCDVPDAKITSVVFADYGQPLGSCYFNNLAVNPACTVADTALVKSKISTACVGKSSCNVTVTNNVFTDPCAGKGKTLAARVVCDRMPSPVPDAKCASGTERSSSASLTCSSAAGTCDSPTATFAARSKCNGATSCVLSPSNTLFGDPCPGVTKSIAVSYTCSQCAVGVERESNLNIVCPSGLVISTLSAYYGTPTSCPTPAAGSCNSPNALPVVQGRCNGKETCNFAVDNTDFGDPCPGVTKSLAVNYICKSPLAGLNYEDDAFGELDSSSEANHFSSFKFLLVAIIASMTIQFL